MKIFNLRALLLASVLVMTLGASSAFAQTMPTQQMVPISGSGSVSNTATIYSGSTVSGSASVNSCLTLSHNLGRGSLDVYTNGDVSSLQNFLSSQGLFPYAAIGIYGPLTARAVANFQSAHGIISIGIVGPVTRAAINSASCAGNGGVVPPPSTTNPTVYNMTPATGAVSTQVSITGFGFTNDNTIHFGYGVVMHVPITSQIAVSCTNDPNCHGGIQQTLTFTVPTSLDPACRYSMPACMIASAITMPGNYSVTVENTNGTSNASTFTVTSATPTPTTVNPVIYHVSPTSGAVGSTVSITGFGFTNNNTVHFGSGSISNVPITSSIAIACTTDPSCHGGINQTITFTVPQYISPYCPPGAMCALWVRQVTPDEYDVSVENQNGTTSAVQFVVTQ